MNPTYQEQTTNNETQFRDIARQMRPDIWSIMDAIDSYGVNYLILLKAIIHLNKIASGSRFGSVTIDVKDGICTFVRGEESNMLNEPVLK